jgi:hypothetical protein
MPEAETTQVFAGYEEARYECILFEKPDVRLWIVLSI